MNTGINNVGVTPRLLFDAGRRAPEVLGTERFLFELRSEHPAWRLSLHPSDPRLKADTEPEPDTEEPAPSAPPTEAPPEPETVPETVPSTPLPDPTPVHDPFQEPDPDPDNQPDEFPEECPINP